MEDFICNSFSNIYYKNRMTFVHVVMFVFTDARVFVSSL